MPESYRIRLGKEDFKFSAAHFTLFPNGKAELLHGHNYRVRLELSGPGVSEIGLLFDVSVVKREIRRRCGELDERTLIPTAAERLRVTQRDEAVEVRCGERLYRFPDRDVVLLPLANVSIELLARMLWKGLIPSLAGTPVEHLSVEVEETPGQSCVYAASLSQRTGP